MDATLLALEKTSSVVRAGAICRGPGPAPGTPEAQELLDAVMAAVAEWDAELRRDPDDKDE